MTKTSQMSHNKLKDWYQATCCNPYFSMLFRNKNQRQIWKSLEIERGINARISPIKIGDIYKDLRCQTKPIAPKKIKKLTLRDRRKVSFYSLRGNGHNCCLNYKKVSKSPLRFRYFQNILMDNF